MTAFWDMTPCSLLVDRRFRCAYCLHNQGDQSTSTRLHGVISKKPVIFPMVALVSPDALFCPLLYMSAAVCNTNTLCLLQMLKSCRKLSMTVKSPNLHLQPAPDRPHSHQGGPWILRQTYSWMDRQGRPVSPPLEYAQATPPVVVAAPPPPPAPRYYTRSNKDKGATRKVRFDGLLTRCGTVGYQLNGKVSHHHLHIQFYTQYTWWGGLTSF
jgi:hypothetical protein